jgi:DNA-binding beta-propeller fold protein YncE
MIRPAFRRGGRWTALVAAVAGLVIGVPARAQNLFWGDIGAAGGQPNHLFTSDLDGGGHHNILLPRAMVVSLDVDASAQRVFWQEFVDPRTGAWRVRSSDLSGGSQTTIMDYTGGFYGLAVDSANQRLYWANGNDITRTDYTGGNAVTIATNVYTQAIEVDPAAGKVFWADQGFGVTTATLMEANLDGTSPQSLASFSTASTYLGGLAVDPTTQTLYFSDYRLGTVSSIPYAGGSTTPIFSGLPGPAGLDLELTTNRLYIVDKELGSLSWANPAGGPLTQVFLGVGPERGEMWDVAAIVPEPPMGSVVLPLGLVAARRRREPKRT